jgi:Immunity protein 42
MSSLIVGNPSVFAIESSFTQTYENLSQRGLGFFLIHLDGISYGVKAPDATLLACSFDAVSQRIMRRGEHVAKFGSWPDSLEVVNMVRRTMYAEVEASNKYFGMSALEFSSILNSSEIVWAPDGDAAFDDGSHVLQFDIDKQVRLIGFKNMPNLENSISTADDVWIDSDLFYNLLAEWREKFETEWSLALKRA